MKKYDLILLTDSRYVAPREIDRYVQNILDEDNLVRESLENRGLKVGRTHWDNPDFDWKETHFALFRTTWDYFDRYAEFSRWLNWVKDRTELINPFQMINWNLDKHYLEDLNRKKINIPPTLFIEPGDLRTLSEIFPPTQWSEAVLKPAISGAGRGTFRINAENIEEHEKIYREFITQESMIIQEFQISVLEKGEVAMMLFGGKYSHAILKKAKPGDFRVQDDFGGSVHDYEASPAEIDFAEKVVSVCNPVPAYARVDFIWDNQGNLSVSELELIEPELWFRNYPPAAELMADALENIHL